MDIKHIVLDSNTWITYFYNAQLDRLVDLDEQHHLVIYTTPRQIFEIKDVLARAKFANKLKMPLAFYTTFVKELAKNVEISERFDRSADKKDNYLVDLAYTTKADHIISSDPHLLNLKHVGRIQIISLSHFKQKLKLAY